MRARNASRLTACILTALMVLPGESQVREPQTDTREAARARQGKLLMEQARAAAGGDEALRRVSGLSASVRLRRFVEYTSVTISTVEEKKIVLKGKILIELQQPDKFLKRVSAATLSGNKVSYVEVVSGNRAWRDPPLAAVSSSRKRHVIDVSDFERSLSYQAQGARQQFTLYSLALLIRRFPEDSLNFASEGWMQGENGKIDVLSVSGPDDFRAGLMLDQKTHLPIGLFQDFIAVRPVPVVVEGFMLSRRRFEEVVQRARRLREARMRPRQRMRVEYLFSDRRLVDGVSLPHRIATRIDGKLVEEMEVTRYKINPSLNPKDFEPKPRTGSAKR